MQSVIITRLTDSLKMLLKQTHKVKCEQDFSLKAMFKGSDFKIVQLHLSK